MSDARVRQSFSEKVCWVVDCWNGRGLSSLSAGMLVMSMEELDINVSSAGLLHPCVNEVCLTVVVDLDRDAGPRKIREQISHYLAEL